MHVVHGGAPESAFVEALIEFLKELGLSAFPHAIRSSAAVRDLGRLVAASTNPAHVAVFAIESESPTGDDGPGSVPYRVSPAMVAAVELCAAELEAHQCLPVAQLGDPIDGGALSLEVLPLSNQSESRTALKHALSEAGCTIAGELLADDRPLVEFEFPSEWWGTNGDVATPSFTEFLVDSAFNRELTQMKLQEKAMAKVRNADELDLKYHYVGWKMAENWNALTDDVTYAHANHRSELAGRLEKMTAFLPKGATLRYISLGPGDGKTDVELLPVLSRRLDITSCFFVDVSIELLQVSTNRVITDLIETGLLSPRHIRAVLGDFEDSLKNLSPVLTGFGDVSLYVLSGFTIGNSTERQLLTSLAQGMQPGDFLLMDARLHGLGQVSTISEDQEEALLKPYKSTAMKKFAFGPVEDLCDYVVRLNDPEVTIDYSPRIGTRFTTDVPNAINVYIDVAGIYASPEFREKVGLNPLRMPGAAGRERKKSLRLVTLTFYDLPALAAWIDESEVFTVRAEDTLDNNIGVLLLERVESGVG